MKNQDKLKDFSYQNLFYDNLGLEHFSLALNNKNRVKHLDISENDLGPANFSLLQKIFSINTHIEFLNIADCKVDGDQIAILCQNLKMNTALKYFYLRNSKIGEKGSMAIAELIDFNKTLVELEIFNCGINESGGNAIGNALKTNFCIEKLSIGDNKLDQKDVEHIQQSVIFNTQFNQMKEQNKKFDGFAHTLIAESLRKWAGQKNFVAAKLDERLRKPIDELDRKIAEYIM